MNLVWQGIGQCNNISRHKLVLSQLNFVLHISSFRLFVDQVSRTHVCDYLETLDAATAKLNLLLCEPMLGMLEKILTRHGRDEVDV